MRLAGGALLALVVVRLLPDAGVGLWLRLLAATLVALLPGVLAARALRLPPASAGLAWALAAAGAGLALAVLLHTGLWLVVAVMAAAAAGAAPWRRGTGIPRLDVGAAAVAAAGLVLGIALWFVAGGVDGDALFHLGRVRKLLELDS
ncbi:MAG: hypothetical protein ACM33B_00175, partial [Pseudomonadota bacterium]